MQILKPKHCNTLCIYSLLAACAQVGKLSPLYFNLRHFSNRSSNRLLRSNAKSTKYIEPQTFAASESVSYPALLCPAISCPAFSCPVILSVIFTSCNFMPCTLVRQFHVRHFHVQHFQRPRLIIVRPQSAPQSAPNRMLSFFKCSGAQI